MTYRENLVRKLIITTLVFANLLLIFVLWEHIQPLVNEIIPANLLSAFEFSKSIIEFCIIALAFFSGILVSYESARNRTAFLESVQTAPSSLTLETVRSYLDQNKTYRIVSIVPEFHPLCYELHNDGCGNAQFKRETRSRKPATYSGSQRPPHIPKFKDGLARYERASSGSVKEHIAEALEIINYDTRGGSHAEPINECEKKRIIEKGHELLIESVCQTENEVPVYSDFIILDDFHAFRAIDKLFVEQLGSSLVFETSASPGFSDKVSLDRFFEAGDSLVLIGGPRSNPVSDLIVREYPSVPMFELTHGSGSVDRDFRLSVRKDGKCKIYYPSAEVGVGVLSRVRVAESYIFFIFGDTGRVTRALGEFILSRYRRLGLICPGVSSREEFVEVLNFDRISAVNSDANRFESDIVIKRVKK